MAAKLPVSAVLVLGFTVALLAPPVTSTPTPQLSTNNTHSSTKNTTSAPSTSPDPSVQNDIGNDPQGTRKSYEVVPEQNDRDEDAGSDDVIDKDIVPRFSLETFVTIAVTLTIVMSNCTIILVAAWTDAFNNFNKVFIYSMTLADLLVGLFVTPYSIFLSVYRRWVFAGDMFCNIEAYFLMCLSGAKLFSLTWLNVDHYIAVRKPERYNLMMSQTRSLCWVIFCWLAPISFSIPPVFSLETSIFNEAVFLCQPNTYAQMAYVVTAGALVSLPAFIALIVTNVYIFTKSYKKRILFYEKVFVELSTRPWKYQTTFVMCLVLFMIWLPYLFMCFIQEIMEGSIPGQVQFYFFWIGISGSATNFLVLMVMCLDFRQAVWDLYRLSDWCPLCRSRARNRRYAYDSDVNIITIQKK